jgi:NADPH:quinone reductase-like Zn-dependent oxidoreductase
VPGRCSEDIVKAIVQDRYGPPDVLELKEIDRPTVGREDDVLLRVHAAGVDPGVWHLTTGLPYLVRVVVGLRKPKVPIRGMDVAGRVEDIGAGVTQFQPGDEVFGTSEGGSFAEFTCARQRNLALKPANLTFGEAAAVPISATTALQALRDKGRVQAGQNVLIIGAAGGVGTFAVQMAKAFGAEVTGVCSTTKADLVQSIGADQVIDYTGEDFAANPQRYDLILDTAGLRSLSHLRRALAPKGILVLIGGEGGGRLLGGVDRTLRAMLISPFVGQTLSGMVGRERKEDLEVLAELIEAGKVSPVIDKTYPLNKAVEAIRYVTDGHARGKVVLAVSPDD